MSNTERYGEAWETPAPPPKVSVPRSVPPTLKHNNGLGSSTDSPIVTNTELSSPFGEDDRSTPHLRVDTTREINTETNDYNPLTGGLDTGDVGRWILQEETFNYFDDYDPLGPSPIDAANQFEQRYNDTEPILGGPPGTEDVPGCTDKGPGLDLDLNEPNFGGFFENERSLTHLLDPTLSQPKEDIHQTTNDAPISIHDYPTADLGGSDPSFVTTHPLADSTRGPGSSSRYSQITPRSYPTRATETIQEVGLTQHQGSYYNEQFPSHHAGSRDVGAGRSLAGANTDVSVYGPTQSLQPSQQSLRFRKRRSVSDSSNFLPQNRSSTSLPAGHGSTMLERRPKGSVNKELTEMADSRYQEQTLSYDFGFPESGIDETPVINATYPQPHFAGHEQYRPRGWQGGEHQHLNNPHAPQNITTAVAHGGLQGGTTDMLPEQFRPVNVAQGQQAMVLPRQQNSEGGTLFGSLGDAKRWRQRHLVPSNKHDPTIPTTPAEHQRAVRRLVEAINDTEEAMKSSYVKYFTDQKYSPEHIESTCWIVLDACKTRQISGPLQTEDERAPFKSRIADYNSFAERLEVVIRALRTQKSICKQIMEPYHLYQFIDDPVAKIKRTENNKALNDRKAEQIAAGKALRGGDNKSRARRGKQKAGDEEESDHSHDVADVLTGFNSASQGSRVASVSASARSTPAASGAAFARKRKLESASPTIGTFNQPETSGPSKRVKTSPASSNKALKFGHRQPRQAYQPQSSSNLADQSYSAAVGNQRWQSDSVPYQQFGQSNAAAYGHPSTGEISGAPYFTQRSNVQRRPGDAYPEIEGYHTPLSGFGLHSAYGTAHGQQHTHNLRHDAAPTGLATSSSFTNPPVYAYTHSNSYPISHEATHGGRKRQAEPEEEGSDFESSQAKQKRGRNA